MSCKITSNDIMILVTLLSAFTKQGCFISQMDTGFNLNIQIYLFMKQHAFVVLILLLACANCQVFYGDFAISWLQGFCDTIGDCMDRKVEDWDHQSFTIHGLWPKTQGASLGPFDIDLIDSQLLDDMRNYWPPQSRRTHDTYFLWEHELQDHGKDYGKVLRSFGNEGTPEQLQVQFFKDVIAFYKSLNFQKLPKGTWTSSQLGAHIGLQDDQWYPRCNDDGELSELRICLKLTPEGNAATNCLKRKPKNCDEDNLVLGQWQAKNQERVVVVDTTDF